MNFKTILKSSVAASALFALAAPVSTTAIAADDSFSTGAKTNLVMSGQVSRVIMHADDGNSSRTFFTGPGGGGGIRIRWIASGTLSDSVTAGAVAELNMPEDNTDGGATLSSTNIGDGGTDGATVSDDTWDLRHQYVWVNHKTMGKVSLGNTSVATDGIGANSGRKHGRGIRFVNTVGGTDSIIAANTVSATFSDLDIGRANNIRYDSVNFGGTSVRFSLWDSRGFDASLRYAGKTGAVAIDGKVGYVEQSASSASTNFTLMGSLSLTHDSGLSVKGGAAKRNYAGAASKTDTASQQGGVDDPYVYSIDLGYSMPKLVSVGATKFNFIYQNSNNVVRDAHEAVSYLVQASQSFDAIGASMVLSYQNFALDGTNITTVGTEVTQTYRDIDVIALQTTFNF